MKIKEILEILWNRWVYFCYSVINISGSTFYSYDENFNNTHIIDQLNSNYEDDDENNHSIFFSLNTIKDGHRSQNKQSLYFFNGINDIHRNFIENISFINYSFYFFLFLICFFLSLSIIYLI